MASTHSLGDSGFAHFRPNATSYVSPAQTHAFNTPYQLSKIPAHLAARQRAFGGRGFQDHPSDAAVTSHAVRHGDVLVFATDGVWDNLFVQDILDIVQTEMKGVGAWVDGLDNGAEAAQGGGVERATWEEGGGQEGRRSVQGMVAVKVAQRARSAAGDKGRVSPFAMEVRKWYPNERWVAGKVDDVCVVVAVVVQEGFGEV